SADDSSHSIVNSCSIFFFMTRRPPISPLFPYTTLFRSHQAVQLKLVERALKENRQVVLWNRARTGAGKTLANFGYLTKASWVRADRKSTRLNSSHVKISYAVFCLKKKKINQKSITNICG